MVAANQRPDFPAERCWRYLHHSALRGQPGAVPLLQESQGGPGGGWLGERLWHWTWQQKVWPQQPGGGEGQGTWLACSRPLINSHTSGSTPGSPSDGKRGGMRAAGHPLCLSGASRNCVPLSPQGGGSSNCGQQMMQHQHRKVKQKVIRGSGRQSLLPHLADICVLAHCLLGIPPRAVPSGSCSGAAPGPR